MKERNAFLKCGECGAEQDLSGVDIGGLDMMPISVHQKGQWPDASEPHNSMLLAESLTDPRTCPSSEMLVMVRRPDETDEEWYARHPHMRQNPGS